MRRHCSLGALQPLLINIEKHKGLPLTGKTLVAVNFRSRCKTSSSRGSIERAIQRLSHRKFGGRNPSEKCILLPAAKSYRRPSAALGLSAFDLRGSGAPWCSIGTKSFQSTAPNADARDSSIVGVPAGNRSFLLVEGLDRLCRFRYQGGRVMLAVTSGVGSLPPQHEGAKSQRRRWPHARSLPSFCCLEQRLLSATLNRSLARNVIV